MESKKRAHFGKVKVPSRWNTCSAQVEQKFRPDGTPVPPRGNYDHPQTFINTNASSPLNTTLKKELNTTSYKQEKNSNYRRDPILTNEEWDIYIKAQGDQNV